jgi:hypothetical protein
VLARVLTDAGVAAEPGLTAAVAAALADDRGVLPAELQLAACALRDQRIATLADWRRLGGRAELARQWLAAGARAGGDERLGLRALGELVGDGATVDELAAGLAATASAVTRALTPLAERGAIVATDGRWRLAHPVLAEPVRDLTALERAVARRSHELLGKRAEAGGRLTLREWWAIEREGIAATTAGRARGAGALARPLPPSRDRRRGRAGRAPGRAVVGPSAVAPTSTSRRARAATGSWSAPDVRA